MTLSHGLHPFFPPLDFTSGSQLDPANEPTPTHTASVTASDLGYRVNCLDCPAHSFFARSEVEQMVERMRAHSTDGNCEALR